MKDVTDAGHDWPDPRWKVTSASDEFWGTSQTTILCMSVSVWLCVCFCVHEDSMNKKYYIEKQLFLLVSPFICRKKNKKTKRIRDAMTVLQKSENSPCPPSWHELTCAHPAVGSKPLRLGLGHVGQASHHRDPRRSLVGNKDPPPFCSNTGFFFSSFFFFFFFVWIQNCSLTLAQSSGQLCFYFCCRWLMLSHCSERDFMDGQFCPSWVVDLADAVCVDSRGPGLGGSPFARYSVHDDGNGGLCPGLPRCSAVSPSL